MTGIKKKHILWGTGWGCVRCRRKDKSFSTLLQRLLEAGIQGGVNSAANYSLVSVESLLHVQVIKESPEMSEKQVPSALPQAQGETVWVATA